MTKYKITFKGMNHSILKTVIKDTKPKYSELSRMAERVAKKYGAYPGIMIEEITVN